MQLQYNNQTLTCDITLPGSKSISNRLLIIQKLFLKNLAIKNISDAQDTQTLIQALSQIHSNTKASIHAGEAGTNFRFLCALLAVTPGQWELSGSETLMKRPISNLIIALKKLGADIQIQENEQNKILINGKTLNGGRIEMDANISSQFISALLLIAPAFKNGLQIKLKGSVLSLPYIKMTISLLQHFGANIQYHDSVIQIQNSTLSIPQTEYYVEGDWSSASYWYSVVALAPAAQIKLFNLHQTSLQGDSILKNLFLKLGVHSEFEQAGLKLYKTKMEIEHLELDCSDFPDIAQTLVPCCFGLGISCSLSGLSTLKNKETHRLLALKNELTKLGAMVEINQDSIQLAKNTAPIKNELNIETYQDHRMAMSFAPLVLKTNSLQISNPEVVNKSYPGFWRDLKMAGISIIE
ncbi:MAG: 3-phosphoshikimate 1-carboxyvinyltransferase [Sphingobacteriaceae bacterium]|nr:3-phosphoshikimate 1-carboxyvinyltransferase [Sphingobacteriaceae bacterium]